MLNPVNAEMSCLSIPGEHNHTESSNQWVYAAEPLLLEMMLTSKHRTLNPEEADLFYVPVYSSCFVEDISAWADMPWFYVDT